MGVAGYSEMARMLGLYDVAEKYAGIAKKMAVKWEEMANEGDHYRLAFDRKNTWSQKYNMIWDKMWNLNLFPNNVISKEVNYYLTKQNRYGLPLDSRKDYTKSDWIMWIAAMSPDQDTFIQYPPITERALKPVILPVFVSCQSLIGTREVVSLIYL